ncbi:MAG: hypothetical protein QOH63_1864 [Acidobacteriota bacterium]|nr:hypothetical protein [Acidobacteriota bacterium]
MMKRGAINEIKVFMFRDSRFANNGRLKFWV